MRTGLITMITLLTAAAITAQAQIPVKNESFEISDVRLTESAFKHAEDMDIRYLLGIDPDRLLAPYLKEAGLEPKAENYTNWENTGLDGHIGGHYLSALSYMYAATGNEEIKGRLDHVIAEMKRCAEANGDGYISGVPNGKAIWKEISEGNIRAASFGLNDRWVPLYNIHKTFAGLRDAYILTGSKDAKKMFLDLTDWMYRLTDGLSEEQMQDMLRSEHGGLNETFADAAAISGDKRHMELAKRFSHKAVLEPLLKGEDRLTGMHANTQIPKVIGYKRIADIEGNREWDKAAEFFWETVVEHRSITIGGNSVREHFHPADDFSSMLESEQGPETCNTYNMLRLTKMLYMTSGESRYMDYYERALYNHILSTINPIQGGFVYFTPMRPGHYRVYSQPQTSFWCCVGSGMENHARYGEMIYSHKGDECLYVNLFIPSVLTWGKTVVEQKNDFPAQEGTSIVVNPEKPREFTVSIRIPEWTKDMKATVNGEDAGAVCGNGYMSISRRWEKGDRIDVSLPMHLRAVSLPDRSDNYSFLYGPVVLAAQTGKHEQLGMYADDSRGGHIAAGRQIPLQEIPVLVAQKADILQHISKVEGKPLTFKLTGLKPQTEMTLGPFNTLHECRYMVYWEVVSPHNWELREAERARMEAERQAVEAATVDKVVCGEQQPESDHFVKMENTENGDFNGLHWRMAKKDGWFEYQMKNHQLQADGLRFICSTASGRGARISVNGTVIGTVSGDGHGVQTCIIGLPDELATESILNVRIEPSSQEDSAFIHEVRLMKQQ